MRLLQHFAVLLASTGGLVAATSQPRNPLGALATLQNVSIDTPAHRVWPSSYFDLTFTLFDNQRIRLALEPNEDIIPHGATLTYLNNDGTIRAQEPLVADDHRVYKGTAWVGHDDGSWTNAGWARIVVERDGKKPLFEGAFAIKHNNHHILSARHYLKSRHALDPMIEIGHAEDDFLVVWRDSDILPSSGVNLKAREEEEDADPVSCISDQLEFNTQQGDSPMFKAMLKRDDTYLGSVSPANVFGLAYNKRQIDTTPGSGNSAGVNLTTTIGNAAGCPTTRKVALVGVAADCTYVQYFNGSTSAARSNIITQMNSASSLYESSFNITLGIQNLTVVDANCPSSPPASAPWNDGCTSAITIMDRLNTFSAWRGQIDDNNSHWTLMTTCNTGSTIGLAWLGMACVNQATTTNSSSGEETVSGTNVVVKTNTEWQVLAHETGHTFGAVHDCTAQTCSDGVTVESQQCCPLSSSTCDAGEKYIMNPWTIQGLSTFSACTIGNICSAIGRNSVKTSCLSDNKGVVTITGQECGNGIVEEGEDCDCGGVEGCGNDPCCNPTTCKFTSGSVCDDSNDACCNSCQFASAGTVCRASTNVCDPQEVCPGNASSCPADVTAPNGQSCGNGLQCASGQCTSRDDQCKSVMGSYTQGNDTYACNSNTCSISCASPDFGPNTCYGLQQNFLDGTPCGGGGMCNNGQCQGSTVGGEVKSWVSQNKALVIGLATSIGALLLASLALCIWRFARLRRNRRLARRADAAKAQRAAALGSRGSHGNSSTSVFGTGTAPAGFKAGKNVGTVWPATPSPTSSTNGLQNYPASPSRPPMASIRYA